MKSIVGLLILFVVEYLIWSKLNYHHKPNEIAIGNIIAFLVFIGSCVIFLYLINKKKDKLAVLLLVHLIGLFFIDRITLDQGGKRYLDSIQETWEFHIDEMKYMVMRNKEINQLSINKRSLDHPERELYNLVIGGMYFQTENGWEMSTDSTVIVIEKNKLIGFPTEKDTQIIRKIYF